MKIVNGITEIVFNSPSYLNDDFEQEIIDFLELNEIDTIEVGDDRVVITDNEGYEEEFIFNDYVDTRAVSLEKGLDYVETTANANGYPSGIVNAIIGFETFEEAKALASQFDLTVETFSTRDGWSLWVRNNNKTYEPFKITSESYGDNYDVINKMDEDDFIVEHVKPLLEDLTEFDSINGLLEQKEILWEAIKAMDDDEVVVTLYGEHFETVKETPMSWSHDTRHYIIGVI